MAFECRLLGVVRLSIIGRFVFLESAIFRRFVWDFSEIWICGLYSCRLTIITNSNLSPDSINKNFELGNLRTIFTVKDYDIITTREANVRTTYKNIFRDETPIKGKYTNLQL